MVETDAVIRSMSVGTLACIAWFFATRNALQLYRKWNGNRVLAVVNSTNGTGQDSDGLKQALFTYPTQGTVKKEHVGSISNAPDYWRTGGRHWVRYNPKKPTDVMVESDSTGLLLSIISISIALGFSIWSISILR
jgi:Protein of unknown function (DUF3592)